MRANGVEQSTTNDHSAYRVASAKDRAVIHGTGWARPLILESLSLDEEIAYVYGAVFDGLNIKRNAEGFLGIVKARIRGHRKVAFVFGRDYAECIEELVYLVSKGQLAWRDDRFPSRG